MAEWISVKDHLPDDGQKVRIWANGEHIATFRKGISEEERRLMKSHEIDDPIVWVWSESTGLNAIPRSDQYYSKDVFGNNLVPYNWEGDGCMVWKGQEVTHWAETSEPPKQDVHEIVTRADLIRAMSDNVMAEYIRDNCFLSGCDVVCNGNCEAYCDEECRARILKWLQQPAKEAAP